MKKIFILLTLLLLVTACGSGTSKRGSIKNVAATVEGANKNRQETEYKSEKEEQLSKMPPIERFFPEEESEESKYSSSLWGTERKSLYADSKASQTGDIIFVIIKEEVTAEINYELTKSGYTNYQEGVKAETLPEPIDRTKRGNVEGGQEAEVETLEGEEERSSEDFNGEGEGSRELIFDGTITARVEGTDKYGNLFIRGSKLALVNNESVLLEISGYVRSRDINTDNTVSSEKLDNMEFTFNGAMYLGKPVIKEFGSNKQLLDNGEEVVEEEKVEEEPKKKKWFFGLF